MRSPYLSLFDLASRVPPGRSNPAAQVVTESYKRPRKMELGRNPVVPLTLPA